MKHRPAKELFDFADVEAGFSEGRSQKFRDPAVVRRPSSSMPSVAAAIRSGNRGGGNSIRCAGRAMRNAIIGTRLSTAK